MNSTSTTTTTTERLAARQTTTSTVNRSKGGPMKSILRSSSHERTTNNHNENVVDNNLVVLSSESSSECDQQQQYETRLVDLVEWSTHQRNIDIDNSTTVNENNDQHDINNNNIITTSVIDETRSELLSQISSTNLSIFDSSAGNDSQDPQFLKLHRQQGNDEQHDLRRRRQSRFSTGTDIRRRSSIMSTALSHIRLSLLNESTIMEHRRGTENYNNKNQSTGSNMNNTINNDASNNTTIFKSLKNESKLVLYSRIFVYIVLIVIGIVFSSIVYRTIQLNTKHQFHNHFDSEANIFFKLVQNEYNKRIDYYELLSKDITILSSTFHNNDNSTTNNNTSTIWPYYTVPDFGIQTQVRLQHSTRSATSSSSHHVGEQQIIQAICPIVHTSQRIQWETYTRVHSFEWIYDSQYSPDYHHPTTSATVQRTMYSSNNNDSDDETIQPNETNGYRYMTSNVLVDQQHTQLKKQQRKELKLSSTTGDRQRRMQVALASTPTISQTDVVVVTNLEPVIGPTQVPTKGLTAGPTVRLTAKPTAKPTTKATTRPTSVTYGNNSIVFIPKTVQEQQEATKFDNTYTTITRLPENNNESSSTTGSLIRQTDSNLFYAPIWQISPLQENLINFDILSISSYKKSYATLIHYPEQGTIVSPGIYPLLYSPSNVSNNETTTLPTTPTPYSMFFTPIVQHLTTIHQNTTTSRGTTNSRTIVALLASMVPIELLFNNIYHVERIPTSVQLVVIDQRKQSYTYQINGPKVTLLGEGDLHDPKYNSLYRSFQLRATTPSSKAIHHSVNDSYIILLYPTSDMEATFVPIRNPIQSLLIVLGICCFPIIIFTLYNIVIKQRQTKTMDSVRVTSRVILSLFPANVLDRLIKETENTSTVTIATTNISGAGVATEVNNRTEKGKIQTFLENKYNYNDKYQNNDTSMNIFKTKPIADLYANATVMYADIAGFTAWSSVREPSQVFTLLEALFHQYDTIAKRRHVFKVETIGDCYVAVAGVPRPRLDHAVAMARFARDCIISMNVLSKKLEIQLGPDTSDLGIRIGLHSGPVTGGILRGEKARFQLFGETVNFCAKIEHTGQANKIHMSQQTADLLIAAGKSSWIETRQDLSSDDIETFWLAMRPTSSGADTIKNSFKSSTRVTESDRINEEKNNDDSDSDTEGDKSDDENEQSAEISVAVTNNTTTTTKARNVSAFIHREMESKQEVDDKIQRLVSWNVEILIRLLKQIIATRGIPTDTANHESSNTADKEYKASDLTDFFGSLQMNVIHEVADIIDMPDFDGQTDTKKLDPNTIEISTIVRNEIKSFVSTIAGLYHDNPFHNFEHASHVTMSVSKLLSRIVAPDQILKNRNDDKNNTGVKQRSLHDHTYGITSDPMTQFACVFSALIHDVDHPGIPNAQLMKEDDILAQRYDYQSIAEQNSVDIAWGLFLDIDYTNFRNTLCQTQKDLKHFRQLIVNSVMATDIVDKDLKELRNDRWDAAFQDIACDESIRDQTNRKATIVIEHLIQASDVSHTMQHWHVYQKWNERFYHEMYLAYLQGRSEKDPSEFWYKGEIGFYDYYIIPLAKKLKDCGVFGVSSDEYIQYAMNNRAEWEQRGEEIVARMVQKYKTLYMITEEPCDEYE